MRITRTSEELIKEFDKLFAEMPPGKRHNIYHDDYGLAKEIIFALYEAGLKNEENVTWDLFGLSICESVYSDVWNRVLAGFDDVSQICTSLGPRYREIKESTLEELVSLSFMKSERVNISKILSKMIKEEVTGSPAGVSEAEDQYKDDPEYGLVPEKPVFVNGLDGERWYLRRLYTADGKKLIIFREGSLRADNVNGIVDIYLTGAADNMRLYGKIYVCMYGSSNSGRAPEGYSLYTGHDPRDYSVITMERPDFTDTDSKEKKSIFRKFGKLFK